MAVSQVVLAALGLGAAFAAIIFALRVAQRQFGIMDAQGKVIDDQVTLLKEHKDLLTRIERVEGEQGVILKRQGEIAERQYQIMEEQLARKAVLEIRLSFLKFYAENTAPQHKRAILQFGVFNSGTRSPQDGLYWKILIPKALGDRSSVKWDEAGTESSDSEDQYGEPCICYENHLKEPVFSKRTTFIGTLDIVVDNLQPHMIIWSIVAEDGAFPSEEKDGEIDLTTHSLQEIWSRSLPKSHRLSQRPTRD
jgi:hypothetical protein